MTGAGVVTVAVVIERRQASTGEKGMRGRERGIKGMHGQTLPIHSTYASYGQPTPPANLEYRMHSPYLLPPPPTSSPLLNAECQQLRITPSMHDVTGLPVQATPHQWAYTILITQTLQYYGLPYSLAVPACPLVHQAVLVVASLPQVVVFDQTADRLVR